MAIPIRVLLLEDREEDALLSLHELNHAGFEPDWKRVDSEAGFAAALDASLDLILADYRLPGWNGLAALALVHARGLEIPFILVSGTIGEEIAVEAMRHGAADYLLKDRLARLGPAVYQQLERKRLRQEKRASEAARADERQRADEALRESEDLYRDLVENSRDLICTHDREGNLLTVNEAATRLTGYSRETLLQMNLAEMLEPEWRPAFGTYLQQVLETGTARGLMRVRVASGETRYWEYDNSLRTRRGVEPVVRGVARDVTETRRAVEALRESEERHRLLFQSSPVPMWVYDLETLRFLAVNQAAVSHYGYSLSEFEGMTIRDIRPADEVPKLDDAIRRVGRDAPRITEIWRHRRKDGSVIDVEVTADSIVFNGRNARLVLAVDVTHQIRAEVERRNAEEALRRSEQKFRDIIDFTPIGFYETSVEGRFLMANRSFAAMFGYESPEELADVDIPSHMYVVPDERSKAFDTLRTTGRMTGAELHLRRKDGTEIWVECNARAITDAAGRMIASQGFMIDIDSRKRAEQALLESEERYRTVVEGADEIIYTLSPEGLLTSVNPAFERITGWSAEEWIGRSFWPLIEEADRERAQEGWRSLLAGSSLPPVDLRLKTRDGGLRVLQGTSTPAFKDGRIVQISAVARDVTEYRRLEQERTDLTRYLDLILQSTDEGLCVVDPLGKVTLVNRSAGRILGYEPEELIGRHLHTTIHHTRDDGRPYPEDECQVFRTVRSARTVRSTEELYWRKDGSSFPADTACSPIFEGDTVSGAVVTFTDIAQRRALESQLEKANRVSSLGRLTATIAHEFNNVLMGIQPFAEVVARSAGANQKMVEAATHIGNSIKRGKRITQEILRFTQPAQPVLTPVPLAAWLQSLECEARPLLHAGITLEVRDASPVDHQMLGDASQLQQVFVNLILNARDALPRGGRIAISAAVDDDDTVYPFGFLEQPSRYVRLTVSDTGSGMSKETMQRIFEPLFTTKANGTGLGLAVTHQVVKRHGGEIFVESQEGTGTSFHLFIPSANDGQLQAAPAAEPLRKPSKRIRILLVEDDSSVSAGLVSILELEGFAVDVADRGATAIEAATRLAPDAIVLDVGLPDMSGIDVYHRIAATFPDLPVIFSTGEGDRSRLEKALERKNVSYLLKPYGIDVLLDRLSRVLSPAP
jgi:PAS domain S-box-containing protein